LNIESKSVTALIRKASAKYFAPTSVISFEIRWTISPTFENYLGFGSILWKTESRLEFSSPIYLFIFFSIYWTRLVWILKRT